MTKRDTLLALTLWIVLLAIYFLMMVALCRADVPIPQRCFVKNLPNGYCSWCSLDCIGRYYKDDRLVGLRDWYAQWPSVGAGSTEIKTQLDLLGVEHEIHEGQSIRWLKMQTDAGVPVVIGIPSVDGRGHAIVAIDVDDKGIWCIDSNDVRWVWRYSHASWDGWGVVVHKRTH